MDKTVLSNPDGSMNEMAYIRLLLICYHPNDQQARNADEELYLRERLRYETWMGPDFVHSEQFKAVYAKYEKRTSQIDSCGLVALCMMFMSANGQTPSISGACSLVEKQLAQVKSMGPQQRIPSLMINVGSDRSSRLLGERKNIAKNFQKHKHVSHIAAAAFLCSEHLAQTDVFTRSREGEKTFLATAGYVQLFLMQAEKTTEWNFYDITRALPKEIDEVLPAFPTEEMFKMFQKLS